MRTVSRLFTFFFAIIIITLSVMNREDVTLIWSLQGNMISVPLYAVMFVGVFLGLLAALWGTGWARLKEITGRRQADRRVAALETEVASLKDALSDKKQAALTEIVTDEKYHETS